MEGDHPDARSRYPSSTLLDGDAGDVHIEGPRRTAKDTNVHQTVLWVVV
jgi:hypothetical protein